MSAAFRALLLSATAALAVGCAKLPIKAHAVAHVEQEQKTLTVSMGETMATKYICPCFETYLAAHQIAVKNGKAIPGNSLWSARYYNTENGDLYLVNELYNRAIAIDLHNGSIDPTAALVQFTGAKAGRTWAFEDAADIQAINLIGYTFDSASWRLYYIGPDGAHPNTVRFSIEDFRLGGERVGQIEYVHDMSKGNEFVVRGMRIRINSLGKDSLMNYTIVSDPS